MNSGSVFSRSFILSVKITVLSAAIGGMIGALRSSDNSLLIDTGLGALTGVAIALGCSIAEFQLFSNPRRRMVRRLPLVVLLVLRAAAYSCFILLGLALQILFNDAPPLWRDPDFAEVFAISAFVAFVFSIGMEITRLLGREATIALFSGRYHRPRLEHRVVLFADIIGSTAIAERIGELSFHEFLSDAALDLAEAVEVTRGDVYKYVGDAVIVTWPIARGVARAACLHCAQDMHRALAARKDIYRGRFGSEARLRVAIHCGQVAAGEIGDWKKEIALLGDTMNTTARIEGAAKSFGEATVLSDDVVRQLPITTRNTLKRLPEYSAAGKKQNLVLWAPE